MANDKVAVIIGDGYVGKTSVLNTIKENQFQEQIPNVYDDFEYAETLNGKQFRIKFIDTAGQEEYDMLRKLSYKEANVFLLCFAVNDRVSFENMETKWIPDLKDYDNVPIILVGTKSDLRNSGNSRGNISRDEIVKFQKKIGAVCYVESSAKTRAGLDDLKKKTLKVLASSSKDRSCTLQ